MLIPFLFLLGVSTFNYHTDVHWPPWFFMELGLCLWMTLKMDYPWLVRACFFWTACSGLVVTSFWHNGYFAMGEIEATGMRALGGDALIATLLFGAVVMEASKRQLAMTLKAFAWLFVVAGVFVTVQKFTGFIFYEKLLGFYGNEMMTGVGMALTMPWWLTCRGWLKWPILLFGWWVIYQSQSSMGCIVGLASCLTYAFMLSPWWLRAILVVQTPFTLHKFGHYFDYQMWSPNIDRYVMWKWAWEFFIQQSWPVRMIGFGNGTLWHWCQFIQLQHQYEVDVGRWVWLHNDWLQTLLEQGIIGFGLYLAATIDAVRRAWSSPMMVAMVASFATACVGLYPTNLALFSFYGLIIALLAFKDVAKT